MTTLYKVTNEDGTSCNGGTGRWTKGRWRSVRGPLVACENGLHLTDLAHLLRWLGPAIWEVETTGEVIDAGDKFVARRARVARRLEAWTERTARLFAADCAEHVLHLIPDEQSRLTCEVAIYVARCYADGEATEEELAAAGAAAWAAAGAAAWAAAGAAAWDAAWDAAGDDAARAAETRWQADRLAEYLGVMP